MLRFHLVGRYIFINKHLLIIENFMHSIQKDIITVKDLYCGYHKKRILHNVSFSVKKNEQWAIIGKNGAGKSTLIKCIARIVPVSDGAILLHDKDLYRYNTKETARIMSYVPQARGRLIPYTVFDYVMLGRYAYQRFFLSPSAHDKEIVNQALILTDTRDYAERAVHTLSGGEAQRVFLAGAVAQQALVMLLDEPTTHLDPSHTTQFYHIIQKICTTVQQTVCTVTHDINAALSHYSHILALKNGSVYFAGTKETFLSYCPDILTEVYDVAFKTFHSPQTDDLYFVPCDSAALSDHEKKYNREVHYA